MRPDHYKKGGIEPFEIMKAKMTQEQYIGFLLGNVIKYTLRFQEKNGVEDLKKAQQYLEWLIQEQPVPTPKPEPILEMIISYNDSTCSICGMLTSQLGRHLKEKHDIAVKYKDTP
jgi:hypothetical protein